MAESWRLLYRPNFLAPLWHPGGRAPELLSGMDIAAYLIGLVADNDEAADVRRAIEGMVGRLVDIDDRLEGRKVHPIIRELLESGKRARAGRTFSQSRQSCDL
jgi:hypothetical protein